MDRNSIIGLLLIGGILVGWMFYAQPSAQEKAKLQHAQDSAAHYAIAEKAKTEALQHAAQSEKPGTGESAAVMSDSVKNIIKKQVYGEFTDAAGGESKTITLENDLMKVNVATKGGRIASVELKKYKTFDGKPLILFNADSSTQNITFKTATKAFATDTLNFVPDGGNVTVTGTDTKKLSMRLYGAEKSRYIEFVYSIKGDEYMMDYRINVVGMQNVIAPAEKSLALNISMKTPMQEQNHQTQARASTVYFENSEEVIDKISEASSESKVLDQPTRWVGLKQQFFTSTFIAEPNHPFEPNSKIETYKEADSSKYVKSLSASLNFPYGHNNVETFGMRVYFGPNHYQTLKKYDLNLERQINLGWKIFGWINRFLVIPIFNVLNNLHMNYGIIILILTIIIKLLMLPIAYRTVLSSAKMRVLKPEIDELNARYKDEDPMKKQQATMALYKQAGVNPMAGCIPVLLQMPILMALFSFFPASIELRQQSFLWAHDMSTYDSVYNFGFSVPWYGDHVSLFALLMTCSTLLYTWSNSQLMGTSNQMPGMKWMMYLMPVLFLGFLNNYSAGLSWYYFLANMFTFGQTWIMQKYVIDSEALHKKMQENKTKPVKQSKFQQRLEAMAKEAQQRQNAAGGKKK